MVVELIVFALLLLLSGFFSSSETSFFSLTPRQLEKLKFDEHPRIDLIERMLSQPRRLIVTILIGNEFVNVAASVLSAAIVIDLMGPGNSWVNLAIMVPVLLLIGEITPKTLALRHNRTFASFQSRPLEAFAWLITPIREVVRGFADLIITLFVGRERSRGNIITEDMVRTLTEAAVGEGALDAVEASYIAHVFDLRHLTAQDVMTPRSHIQYFAINRPLAEMVYELRGRRHTRIPIYAGTRDRIIGVLFARDLLGMDLEALGEDPDAFRRLLRPAYFVPESKPAADLFHGMRRRRQSLAFAVDEYGGVTGIVTMEDLLARIFGEKRLPFEKHAGSAFQAIGEGRYRFSGQMRVREFNARTGSSLPEGPARTVGGVILHLLGELPEGGTILEHEGLRFTVTAVHDNRVHTVIAEGFVLSEGEMVPGTVEAVDAEAPADAEDEG